MKIFFLLTLLGILVFLFRLNTETKAMDNEKVRQLIENHNIYTANLKVVDDPEVNGYSTRLLAVENSINMRVIVQGSSQYSVSSFNVGDSFIARGSLNPLNDYQQYKRREHVVANFHIISIESVTTTHSIFHKSINYLRNQISIGCSRLSSEFRGVCEGLLIGEKRNINKPLYSKYVQAQLTHILVASGANIAFLIGFISPVLQRFNRRTSSVVVISVTVIYCILTRCDPSILRATIMVVLPASLICSGRKISIAKLLFFTVMISSILDPFLVFRVGFWLSVSAAFGINVISPIIGRVVHSQLVSNTLSATICVQPVLWIVFGFKIPVNWWVSTIAVFIAEPLSSLGMTLVIIISYLSPQSHITHICILGLNAAYVVLNGCAYVGSAKLSVYFGCILSAIMAFAYTYGYIKQAKQVDGDVRQAHFLYYR